MQVRGSVEAVQIRWLLINVCQNVLVYAFCVREGIVVCLMFKKFKSSRVQEFKSKQLVN